ncbi:MAG: hypothetical protein M3463_22575 [Verrucomicrobiota bacterium]|nr:hypothetical protein [Verrucomicrobiota bacterium]
MNFRLTAEVLALPAAIARAAAPPRTSRRHGPEKQKGEVRVDDLPADFTSPTHADTWLNVMDQVSSGEMPPEKEPRPPQADATTVVE